MAVALATQMIASHQSQRLIVKVIVGKRAGIPGVLERV